MRDTLARNQPRFRGGEGDAQPNPALASQRPGSTSPQTLEHPDSFDLGLTFSTAEGDAQLPAVVQKGLLASYKKFYNNDNDKELTFRFDEASEYAALNPTYKTMLEPHIVGVVLRYNPIDPGQSLKVISRVPIEDVHAFPAAPQRQSLSPSPTTAHTRSPNDENARPVDRTPFSIYSDPSPTTAHTRSPNDENARPVDRTPFSIYSDPSPTTAHIRSPNDENAAPTTPVTRRSASSTVPPTIRAANQPYTRPATPNTPDRTVRAARRTTFGTLLRGMAQHF
jgi:hypothetical protein